MQDLLKIQILYRISQAGTCRQTFGPFLSCYFESTHAKSAHSFKMTQARLHETWFVLFSSKQSNKDCLPVTDFKSKLTMQQS